MAAPQRGSCAWLTDVSFLWVTAVLMGCASPASPRPPSLHLPEQAQNVSAVRSGEEVQLRFSVPRRTTDGQAIHGGVLNGSLCREDSVGGACQPVHLTPQEAAIPVPAGGSGTDRVLWTDRLPPELRDGAPRAIAYRVTLSNKEGRSAGASDAVYAASGAAPARVEGFRAEGVRPGAMLRWTAVAGDGEVLLQRTQVDPSPEARRVSTESHARFASAEAKKPAEEPGTVWLGVSAEGARAGETIDASVVEGVRYSYLAVRQVTVKVGGRTLELRSAPSAQADLRWLDTYPPAMPQGLSALGYVTGQAGATDVPGYAVDLVWQPVNDARVSGYVVMRQQVDAAGAGVGAPVRLTASPVTTTGFHDATAEEDRGYRYAVSAVDAKGNQSAASVASVTPLRR